MKYGNFYDLESLTLLNRHEGCACSIKECDVEKVNRLISRMREAMTGKFISAFSHRHLFAMKMKSVPVTIPKEALGLQPVRNC